MARRSVHDQAFVVVPDDPDGLRYTTNSYEPSAGLAKDNAIEAPATCPCVNAGLAEVKYVDDGTKYAWTVAPSGAFVRPTVVVQVDVEQVNVVAVRVGTVTVNVVGESERLREYWASGAVVCMPVPAYKVMRMFAASLDRYGSETVDEVAVTGCPPKLDK